MKTTKTFAALGAILVVVACGSQNTTSGTSGTSNQGTSGGNSGMSSGVSGTTTGSSGAATTGANGATGSAGGETTGSQVVSSGSSTGSDQSGSGGATGDASGATGGSGAVAMTGSQASSGTTTETNPVQLPNRVRSILPFDTGWLFHYGDAAGAEGATFADSSWRTVNAPHDWSIEGPSPPSNPFSMSAATTGRGAYAPSGIGWYRKHFTLPQNQSGDKVYVEFDGVMENSTVYINGTSLGQHPYGYVSFRYDMTSGVKFGSADNVLAVKTDTSAQPAERYYTGAGLYRHVRVLVTNPVHIDQYATYVTTPAPTTASATVNVKTSVVNSGTTSQSVTVAGIVSDAGGTALPTVTTAAQTLAAGASATFSFAVPVTNPKLWDPTSPNMYTLLTNVAVGGSTIDDDATPFGIREILFNNGMTINGKSFRFRGVADHQDFHALGAAAPQRAVQRRLAELKSLGANAVRTAHNPPSPDFLDMADRMGFLILDEFTDVWTGHKYDDVADYSTYFGKTASIPTGMPAVPGVASGALWWQVDFTGWIMRDRNHPSVALFSVGNEIRDSATARQPTLAQMVSIAHTLDTTHKVTQALLDPSTNGDIGGPTNMLVDVWGDNYNVASCLTAMTATTTKSGVLTEIGTETKTWATVLANPGLTGMFMWAGVAYLGEEPLGWPLIGGGGTAGNYLLDAMGTPSSIGQTWQSTWGVPVTGNQTTGMSATKLVVTPDHTTITADVNDISYVKAAITDGSGGIVTSATKAITFAITGPGTIVAVDSASMTDETFRGNTRNAFGGAAYALVQATGPGAITVTASSSGLTGGTATLTGTAGPFVPCSGSCD